MWKKSIFFRRENKSQFCKKSINATSAEKESFEDTLLLYSNILRWNDEDGEQKEC